MLGLTKAKNVRLALAILFLVLGAASLFGIVLFSVKLLYIPLILCTLSALISVYASPLFFFAYIDLRLCVRIFKVAADREIYDVDGLSFAVGIKKDSLAALVKRAVRKGYVGDFSFDGELLTKTN